jgi:TonB family protein
VNPSTRPAAAPPFPWRAWAAGIYAAGALFFLARLAVGMLYTRRVFGRTSPVEVAAAAPVEECAALRVPVTVGVFRPRVLLPAGWREWPAEKLHAVLAHETAHAARRDPGVAALAALNRAVFWFHPLAWWLERRLAELAEHVADDAARAESDSPAGYARVVLEMATHMDKQQGRLIWNGAAMAGPLVARRVRRVLEAPLTRRLGRTARTGLAAAAFALLWMVTAVDFRAAAATEPATFGYRMPSGLNTKPLDAAEQSRLEAALAGDPEDEAVRARLLMHYMTTNQTEKRMELAGWLVEHHPESALHASIVTGPPFDGDPALRKKYEGQWRTAASLHSGDAEVLGNAARAIREPRERLELATRAQQLNPERWSQALGMTLFLMVAPSLRSGDVRSPEEMLAVASEAQQRTLGATDARVLRVVLRQGLQQVAQQKLSQYAMSLDAQKLGEFTSALSARLEVIDPGSAATTELLALAQATGEGRGELVEKLKADQARIAKMSQAGKIRVGSSVQATQLVTKVDPVYPEIAKRARIQGVVRFQVSIGKDGHVTGIELLNGHPLLVPGAIAAVKQWVYKPTMLNGNAVEVITTVDMNFSL